ncbi:hypothetical protein RN001_005490 [Aquatica leii]|uniref:DUF4806 domain-containing protein n=1 Tax=Aquatica leii TaxID=1421715 RepID=A0AAN7PJY0_9COLE|nr:hypothetical protein RN001_005490 [Aquatica leii]
MWIVVHFKEDNTVECVPKLWYNYETNTCFFPKDQRAGKVYELIRSMKPVQEGWPLYKSEVLGEYAEFNEAQSKTEKARDTNFLSSHAEDVPSSNFSNQRKSARTKKRNRKYISESSSSNEDFFSSDDTVPNKKKKQYLTETEIPNAINQSEMSNCVIKQEPSVASNPHSPTISNSFLRYPTISDEFQQQILVELNLIKNILQEHSENFKILLNTSSRQVQEISNTETSSEFENLIMLLPLNSERLEIFEQLVNADKRLQGLMVNELSRMGGRDPKQMTKKIMYRVITNKTGQLYSWEGAKGKRPFKVLTLSKIILNAVRKNPGTAEATDLTIIDTIKSWLVKAKARADSKTEDN